MVRDRVRSPQLMSTTVLYHILGGQSINDLYKGGDSNVGVDHIAYGPPKSRVVTVIEDCDG